jgi:hypothetical protein
VSKSSAALLLHTTSKISAPGINNPFPKKIVSKQGKKLQRSPKWVVSVPYIDVRSALAEIMLILNEVFDKL